MDRGVVRRMLQLAAVAGDDVLAQNAIKLNAQAGHALDSFEYGCWMRACVSNNRNDVIGALEALISASTEGVSMFTETEDWSASSGLQLQEGLALSLSRSARMLDNVYFALVDLVRGDYRVPPMALHAIIMASGQNGKLDRSFATFAEMESLFGLQLDIHTYNALLWANAKCMTRFKGCDLEVMFSILEKIDAAGFRANSQTFDILLSCMVELATKEHHHHSIAWEVDVKGAQPIDGLDHVLSMAAECGAVLKPGTLRSLIRALAEVGDWERTEALIAILEAQVGEDNIPKFFLQQIDDISKDFQKQAQEQEEG